MSDASSPQQPQEPPKVDDGRRKFCRLAIGGMTAISVGTVGYPVATFLKLPKSMKPEEQLEVALDELADNEAFWGERMGQQIVIIKVDGEPLAFNGACPHLGCVVQWDGASRLFKCPCHGADFNDRGVPVAGPVNQPLEEVKFEVEDGVLKVI